MKRQWFRKSLGSLKEDPLARLARLRWQKLDPEIWGKKKKVKK